jgi:hypothetical protein
MTTQVFNNQGLEAATIETLVGAVLAGGAEFLKTVGEKVPAYIEMPTSVFVGGDTTFVEAFYNEIEYEAPSILSSSIPDAAALSSFAKYSAIGLGLAYAAIEIATADNPSEEFGKQSILLGSGLIISDAAVATLVGLGLGAAEAAAFGAVVAGFAVYKMSENWPSIVADIQSGIAAGATAEAAAEQATSSWLDGISSWLSATGSDAISLLQNSDVAQNIGNTLGLLKSALPDGAFPNGGSCMIGGYTASISVSAALHPPCAC